MDTNNLQNGQKKVQSLLRDRTFLTLLLAGFLITVMGMLRPDRPEGMYPKEYWATKMTWRNCADIVITGDSRAVMGVCPGELEKVFSGTVAVNYGFPTNWYSQEYMKAVENLLFPESKNKRIFLGISPHALTNRTNLLGGFMEMKDYQKRDIYIDIELAAILEFFEPMSINEAKRGLFGNPSERINKKYFYPNGFILVHKEPCNMKEIGTYKKLFEQRQVSDKIIKNITDFTSKWKGEGIKVYGFLIPSTKEMVELEKTNSGFNKEKFETLFKQAGGIWIDFDLGAYSSIDGSHLQDDGAYRFSADLAKRAKEIENKFTKEAVQ
jgi:hypothetical protein